MVIFQLQKYNLLYIHQIGIIKTAAATISDFMTGLHALSFLWSF